MKKLLVILILLASTFTLISCKTEEPVDIPTFTVSFRSSGGSSVEQQIVNENDVVNEPLDPTRTNNVFRYWYLVNENLPYDFSTPVTEKMSLTALWSTPDVALSKTTSYEFTNITTEFDVADTDVNLYYSATGNIPYIKVTDFFNILTGFIDPEVEFTITENESELSIFYQYYDEDEDVTYDLETIFSVDTNLIKTNDSGFYWAYIYSTETNYGRNIEYLNDYVDNEEIGGDEEIIYNLNQYNLDLAYYDGSVVAPFYLVNQLFAGSSYYNVYFNGDSLNGIYGTLSSGSTDYMKIRRSSFNNTTPSSDLLQHNYDMLAFNLDHFYGLKDIAEVSSYYSVLANYRPDLLSTDYTKVSQAIADILLLEIDDPHTSYGFSGYYAATSYNPPTNSLSNYGERFNEYYMDGYSAVDDAIAAKWNVTSSNSWSYLSPKRPDYWLIDNNSAVISFDEFVTSDIEETDTWQDEPYQNIFSESNILPVQDQGSRYFVFNQSDNTNDISETLIWGLTNTFVADYKTALESDGWTEVKESTLVDYHLNGYYTKVINDVEYMATVAYNSTYNAAYIGLTSAIPATYDANWKIQSDIVSLINADSAIYLETMLLEIIENHPTVTNIGLDLTFNGGGNVGALFRIVGLISDDPFAVSGYERDMNNYSTSYITTSYASYTQFDWFLLTSLVTYSAANELTTMFEQNDLGIIIGRKTGGGAASITPILLPDGTFFTMSSNSLNAIRLTDGTYEINEFGVSPTFEIEVSNLYDNDTLAAILNDN